METIKTKSAAKVVIPLSPAFETKILNTMETISKIVGGTLGPGGHPVLIERQEYGLPPMVTKDGVTVFRALGFEDAIAHTILEAARDASVRTATEAGDGTTTATILSEAFVRYTINFCKKNPTVPPIRVIKTIQKIYQEYIIPHINKITVKCDFTTPEGKKRLWSVAKISANGDADLADAIIKCFDLTGDEGNVTIVESTGESKYEVEKIDGFPLPLGYEESCAKFFPVFINDPATQRVIMDKPIFILYFGRLNDLQTALDILNRLQDALAGNYLDTPNIVLVATGFSESVLANLANIWIQGSNINVFPLAITVKSAVLNSDRHMIDDIAAVTGAEVFDPLTKPLSSAVFEDLGNLTTEDQVKNGSPYKCYVALGVKQFECSRYRSVIVGHCADEILFKRVDEIKSALKNIESEYDQRYLQERLAKLSGGIAKLKVLGSSNGELKERRDRAEDAVCAVRGAIAHGALIGGGWSLLSIQHALESAYEENKAGIERSVIEEVINPSLLSVVQILFSNAGLKYEQQPLKVFKSLTKMDPEKAVVTDCSTGEVVNALHEGILDSLPAVQEAIKNSISIATLLGTLGGCIVFPRDHVAERSEARDANDFDRMSKSDLHNERV